MKRWKWVGEKAQETSCNTGMHDNARMCHLCATHMNSGCVLECRDAPTLHCVTPISTLMVTIWSLHISVPLYCDYSDLWCETDLLLRYMYIHIGVFSLENATVLLVYQARPLSPASVIRARVNYARGKGEGREGLADVISIHDMRVWIDQSDCNAHFASWLTLTSPSLRVAYKRIAEVSLKWVLRKQAMNTKDIC